MNTVQLINVLVPEDGKAVCKQVESKELKNVTRGVILIGSNLNFKAINSLVDYAHSTHLPVLLGAEEDLEKLKTGEIPFDFDKLEPSGIKVELPKGSLQELSQHLLVRTQAQINNDLDLLRPKRDRQQEKFRANKHNYKKR